MITAGYRPREQGGVPLALHLLPLVLIAALGTAPAAGAPGPGTRSAPARTTASVGASVDAAGSWPLTPRPAIVQGFDPPDTPWGAGHRGVDLLGAKGQAVHASLAGVVRYAGMLAGRPLVVLDHGAVRTTYEPVVPAPGVVVGTRLAQGAVLGTLTTGGSHCAPRVCLHWGLLRNLDDTYLDPLSLVGDGPVRLLPWSGAAPSRRLDAAAAPSGSRMPWAGMLAALAVPAALAAAVPALPAPPMVPAG